MYQRLKETGLIGTEKKPLELNELPDDIAHSVESLPASDPESTFLQALSLTDYYFKAGSAFPTGKTEEPIKEITESLPEGEFEVIQIFNLIEDSDFGIKEHLLNQWLDLFTENSLIAPSGLIVKLLAMANNFSKETKEKVLQVIGNKGKWILSFHHNFNYMLKPSFDIWAEGTTDERKNYLRQLRLASPSEALEPLKETWDAEAITTKKSFLEIIKETLVPDDFGFVQELYQNEFGYHANEKKTSRECRELLAGVLLSFPESELAEFTTSQLNSYVRQRKKSSLLGLVSSSETVVELPKGDSDDFFNPEVMLSKYGFETQHYDIALFDDIKTYWLGQLLEVLPFAFWSDRFQSNTEKAVNYFITSSEYQTKIKNKPYAIFTEPLVRNSERFRDHNLAQVLINKVDAAYAVRLMPYLLPEHYEAYMRKHHLLAEIAALESGPHSHGRSWSNSFSKDVVKNAFSMLEQAPHRVNQPLGKVVAKYLDPEIIQTLEKYNSQAKETSRHNSWNKNFYLPVKTSLEVRNMINLTNQKYS